MKKFLWGSRGGSIGRGEIRRRSWFCFVGGVCCGLCLGGSKSSVLA